MKLNCPSCQTEIQPKHINMKRLTAFCDECNHIFRFENMVPFSSTPNKKTILQPQKVQIKHEMGRTIIEWQWAGFYLVYRALFLVLVLALVAYLFNRIFPEGTQESDWTSWLNFLLLPPIWFVPGMIYSLLAGFINKTQVILDNRELKVKHGPVPWLGWITLDRYDIVQIFTKMTRKKKKGRSYYVYAILANGKEHKILTGRPAVANSDLLLFVAQELEAAMGIEDKRVQGEFTGQDGLPSFREVIDMVIDLKEERSDQSNEGGDREAKLS